MMNAIKILLSISVFFLFIECTSSKKESVIQRSNKKEASSTDINYKADSLFFSLKITGLKSDSFLLTNCVFVKDSCFGNNNPDTMRAALLYADQNNLDADREVAVNYLIQLVDSNRYKELWSIRERYNTEFYFELAEGRDLGSDSGETFLKVIRREPGSLSCKCLNFSFEDKENWEVVSMEKIIADKYYGHQLGYCIDTKSKLINFSINGEPLVQNEIDFEKAFNEGAKYMKCNEIPSVKGK